MIKEKNYSMPLISQLLFLVGCRKDKMAIFCKAFFVFYIFVSVSGFRHKTNYDLNSIETTYVDNPPHHRDHVAMARYIMHKADWTSFATTSVIPEIKGFPFTSIVSMSDGTVEDSTGIPYFYLTPLDFPTIDIKQNNSVTISATLEQTEYCRKKNYVPDDPRCARVMLSGQIEKVQNGTSEYEFAKKALFTRHHSMAKLPKDHGFYVAKLKIIYICLLDWFGGPEIIPVNKYLEFNYDQYFLTNNHISRENTDRMN